MFASLITGIVSGWLAKVLHVRYNAKTAAAAKVAQTVLDVAAQAVDSAVATEAVKVDPTSAAQ